ncbi:hydroxyacylglutathione hydrolase [Sphingomonas sp. GCM10030256]|uniref:hydroxyacylglutathione hydrolase n=1 Tax=Sphingomonas sp. GCM10030256 TaxID=3273427 RepID=UPI003622B32D
MTAAFAIEVVPALSDNYVWLLHDPASGETAVIDPAVDEPVLRAADARGWRITQILNTHWHPDHVGGNLGIKQATGCIITGPAAEADRIPGIDRQVGEGDRVAVGSLEARVWEVPAHTAGHIAYLFDDAALAFVGDTLFAMGCGRLFEGTAEQMHHNLQRLATLPETTAIYAAHEYTLANARFSAAMAPDDPAVAERLAAVEQARRRGEITLPTTIGQERSTNLFMRAGDIGEFAQLREAKDSFRS